MKLINSRFFNSFFILITSIGSFSYPLIKFNKTFLTRDWGLFNSLSHFNRSAFLHYKTIPKHNPYVLGGMDVLANPQTKVFSPLVIFDILLEAPFANLISLITLNILGGFGMLKLLNHLGVQKVCSVIVTFLYMNASWFALHFAEGHIIFGSFQLFSWVLLYTITLESEKSKIYLAIILSFMVLDGGFYAFIYSLGLIIMSITLKLNSISTKKLLFSIKNQKLTTISSIIIFSGLASAKIIPLLTIHGKRVPIQENIQLDFSSIFHSFFNPFQEIHLKIQNASYLNYGLKFHEVGAYIGVLSFFIALYFTIKNYKKNILPYLIIILFFFWIGTGIGGDFNPWTLFQKLPIINNAHIQTRALFIVYFLFLLLFSFALQNVLKFAQKRTKHLIIGLLFIEALFVSNYAYYKVFQREFSVSESNVFKQLISNTKVEKTTDGTGFDWGYDFRLYESKNVCSKSFMDPARNIGNIKTISDDDYEGEAYLLSGTGIVEMIEYTPNHLKLNIDSDSCVTVQINTNFLSNWKSNSDITIFEKDGLLTFKSNSYNKSLILEYRPKYMSIITVLYTTGLILIVLNFFYLLRKKKKSYSTVLNT